MASKRRTPARKGAHSHTRARDARGRRVRAKNEATRVLKAKARFLKEFAQNGNVSVSCRAAKVGRRTIYDWLEVDPTFKGLYEEAHDEALDALEEEARRRAVDGVNEPVYQGGEKVGTVRKFSDALLILLLKGKRPDTFRERHEVTGKNGGPLHTQTDVILKAKSTLLEKLTRLSGRAQGTSGPADGGAPGAES